MRLIHSAWHCIPLDDFIFYFSNIICVLLLSQHLYSTICARCDEVNKHAQGKTLFMCPVELIFMCAKRVGEGSVVALSGTPKINDYQFAYSFYNLQHQMYTSSLLVSFLFVCLNKAC